jgi:DNA-binding MarR family transcriptional regulator
MESSVLTEKISEQLLDHIGLDLTHAARAWRRRLGAAMVARGHAWLAEGRGALVEHIGREGTSQLELTRRAGMSKQAVQQHLDELAADGVLERVPDPADARRNLVRFTKRGLAALRDANDAKREIERDYVRLLGAKGVARLRAALRTVAAAD